MNNFTNNIVDNDKMFYVYSSELEGRLDPFYYQPSIRELEKKVRKQSSKKLRNYISKISSGATPSVQEEDKYYSDKENGIPFLRVQNLQTNGKINLEDVKYINLETHNKLLKRSQVAQHDLLVKITGVGRMAIASVAPDNFVGNTNQHMAVIKTDNKLTSEYLSSYLNLDFVEKLASRRATGGTRPALDYPALKSIPIIENIDFAQLVEAEKQKAIKEKEAKKLLNSIDDYLLEELGISIPERDNSLQSRKFIIDFIEVSGQRLDPFYNHPYYKIINDSIAKSPFTIKDFREVISFLESGSRPTGGVNSIEEGILSLGGEHVNDKCEVEVKTPKYIPNDYHSKINKTETKLFDILLVKDGATTGKIGIIEDQRYVRQNINEHVYIIRTDINPNYLVYLLHSPIGQVQLQREITGSTVTGLTKDALKKIKLPIPSLDKQTEIALHIKNIRNKAKQIQEEANNILNQAKLDLQNSLLNK